MASVKDFNSSGCSSRYFFATYPHGADRGNQYTGGKVTKGNLAKMPVTKKESHLLQWLSKTDLQIKASKARSLSE